MEGRIRFAGWFDLGAIETVCETYKRYAQPHQWLVNPQAIEVWAHTAPALCSEPKCYLAAKYQVAFPRQAPVLFCSRHTKLRCQVWTRGPQTG